VTVYPYVTPEGEKKNAGGASGQTNILPVAISLDNESEGVIVVRREEMSLELSDGSQLFATDPQYVTVVRGPVQETSGSGGFVPMGAAPAAGLIVAVVVLGAVVWYLTHKAPPGTKISEFTDEFITLQKGQSAQGIVFFVTPQGSA